MTKYLDLKLEEIHKLLVDGEITPTDLVMECLDRIEENIAVCENEDMTFSEINVSLLPKGVKDGDCIIEENGVYTIDVSETKKRKAEVDKLLDDIFG